MSIVERQICDMTMKRQLKTWTPYLSDLDTSVLIIIVCFHEAFFQLRQHGVGYYLEQTTESHRHTFS